MRKNTLTYGTKGHKENTKYEKHEIALTMVLMVSGYEMFVYNDVKSKVVKVYLPMLSM